MPEPLPVEPLAAGVLEPLLELPEEESLLPLEAVAGGVAKRIASAMVMMPSLLRSYWANWSS